MLPPSKAEDLEMKVMLRSGPISTKNWKALFILQSKDILSFTASMQLFCTCLSIAFDFIFLKNLGMSLCENKQELSDL